MRLRARLKAATRKSSLPQFRNSVKEYFQRKKGVQNGRLFLLHVYEVAEKVGSE